MIFGGIDIRKASVSKFIKAGSLYTLSNFFTKGIAFLSTPIFVRLLNKTEFGEYSNYSSWLIILTLLTTLGLESSLARASIDFKDEFDRYVSSVTLLGMMTAGVFYAGILCFKSFFVELFHMDFIYISIMFATIIISPAMTVLITKNTLLYRYKSVFLMSAISSVLSLSVSFLLTWFSDNKLFGKIIGEALPSVVIGVVLLTLTIYKGKCLFNRRYWRYALVIGVPLVPHMLANYALAASDKIMITNICKAELTAVYTIAYTCSVAVNAVFDAMNKAWVPWFMVKLHAKEHEVIKNASKPYILSGLLLTATVMLIGPEILLIIGGKAYYEARYLMLPIVLGCAFQFIYTLFVNTEFYKKKSVTISIGTMIAAFINIALNALLLPVYGYKAAAYTTLAGYVILALYHFLATKKIKLAGIFPGKLIIVSLFSLLLWNVLMYFLYDYRLLRYILLTIIMIILSAFAIKPIYTVLRKSFSIQ